jgi:hypothetical protein
MSVISVNNKGFTVKYPNSICKCKKILYNI